MNNIHVKYNLSFVNKVIDRRIYKTCDLTRNPANLIYVGLSTYLIYVQTADDILESVLPNVEGALNGEADIDVSCETVDVTVEQINTIIEWNGKTETLPTVDFKSILEEYAEFLQTLPLHGSGV